MLLNSTPRFLDELYPKCDRLTLCITESISVWSTTTDSKHIVFWKGTHSDHHADKFQIQFYTVSTRRWSVENQSKSIKQSVVFYQIDEEIWCELDCGSGSRLEWYVRVIGYIFQSQWCSFGYHRVRCPTCYVSSSSSGHSWRWLHSAIKVIDREKYWNNGAQSDWVHTFHSSLW